MPTAHVNDIDIYYEIHGEGDPLVLLSGFAVGSWIWFKQIPALSPRFKTIILDNRGTGQSGKPEARHTIKAMADDVAGLLEHLHIDNAHILGASMGGFIAQEFALAYPQRTRSLILCATGYGGPNYVLPPEEVLSAMSGMEGLGTAERARQNVQLFFSPSYLTDQPEEVERVINIYLQNPTPEHSYLNHLIATMAFDAESRIPSINVPTLVITGDLDRAVPPQNSQLLADCIPHATLEIVSGTGHAVFMEKPAEFHQILINFLETAKPSN